MRWKATNRSKAFGERFMLYYTSIWFFVVTVIIIFKWYEHFTPNDFIVTGVCLSLPCVIGPLIFASKDEREIPVFQRYIVKANIFVGILSYLGSHFYSHYLFNVVGARYTGPLGRGKGLEINQVPVSMFLMTHPYFMTYHVLVTPLIRAVKSSIQDPQFQYFATGIFILLIAFLTAFLETFTISGFPYYTFPDLYQMLTKGSVFYGTFFVVTFPWFYRLDEKSLNMWPVSRVVVEALAAMMVVLMCADFWRLGLQHFGYISTRHVPYGNSCFYIIILTMIRWKASNRSKVFGERFMLYYTPIWILVMAVIVIFKWYEHFTPNDFIVTGVCLSLPCVIGPLVFASKDERGIPVFQRYIVKANIFVGILAYLGNHFYTHYFYNVLGTRYTGPLGRGRGIEINQVPISMFLMTHPYFMTYHVLVTPLIRAVKSSIQDPQFRYFATGIFILLIAFLTAFLETFTISGFPYYTYPDFYQMLTKGSVFYGTFFVVTFPWFYRLDEKSLNMWPVSRVVVEALAAMIVVLMCADFWRLGLQHFGYISTRHVPYG